MITNREMSLDDLKRRLQGHFTDGLVTIIGSGLSSAEGLPGMAELAEHLSRVLPPVLDSSEEKEWNNIAEFLTHGNNIEKALMKFPVSPGLEEHVVNATADYIFQTEMKVINRLMSGEKVLRLTRLLPHMLKPPSGIPVITTNYDRLIEIAAEMAELGVDTLFIGHHFGIINEKESRFSFCRGASLRKRTHVTLNFADKVLLLKPHGSLDWYLHNAQPIRTSLNISAQRLIITPGLNKFRTGYDRPFDIHRGKANECIDRALRFLFIGYGFNDDHLQTHLEPKLKEGTAALILVQRLSDNAKRMMSCCSGMFAITAPNESDKQGALYIDNNSEVFFPGPSMWDLGVFIKEVLEP